VSRAGLSVNDTLIWPFLANWHHSGSGASPKRPTHAVFNRQIYATVFIIATLSQQLGILRGWIKGQDLTQWQNVYLPPPINKDGFHDLSTKKIICKVDKKIIFPLVSFLYNFSLFLTLLPLQPQLHNHHEQLP
jgi:hypothetical protein